MSTRIRAAIFDFDDTILATFESRSPCLIQAAADFGYCISTEDIRQVWGKPFRDMISSLLPFVDYSAFYAHYQSVMESHTPDLKPGALALINYLRELGIYIAVVSSSSRALVEQDLVAVGIMGLVNTVWGYEDSAYHKPDPRSLKPVLAYLEERGMPKDTCMCIGDSTRDYLSARGNEVLFFAVTTGQELAEAFLQSGLEEDCIVSDLNHLLSPNSRFMRYVLPERNTAAPNDFVHQTHDWCLFDSHESTFT